MAGIVALMLAVNFFVAFPLALWGGVQVAAGRRCLGGSILAWAVGYELLLPVAAVLFAPSTTPPKYADSLPPEVAFYFSRWPLSLLLTLLFVAAAGMVQFGHLRHRQPARDGRQ